MADIPGIIEVAARRERAWKFDFETYWAKTQYLLFLWIPEMLRILKKQYISLLGEAYEKYNRNCLDKRRI